MMISEFLTIITTHERLKNIFCCCCDADTMKMRSCVTIIIRKISFFFSHDFVFELNDLRKLAYHKHISKQKKCIK